MFEYIRTHQRLMQFLLLLIIFLRLRSLVLKAIPDRKPLLVQSWRRLAVNL